MISRLAATISMVLTACGAALCEAADDVPVSISCEPAHVPQTAESIAPRPPSKPVAPAASASVAPMQAIPVVLLPVRLPDNALGELRSAVLELVLSTMDGEQLVFTQTVKRHLGNASADADFAFRLTLPDGEYRLVRLEARLGPPDRNVRMGIDLDIPFKVSDTSLQYPGTLLVMAGYRGERPVITGLAALKGKVTQLAETFPNVNLDDVVATEFDAIGVVTSSK